MNMDLPTMEFAMMQRAAVRGLPVHGSIELTPLCNMNCEMCYVRLNQEEMSRQGQLKTVNEWIRIAKQMQRAGVLFLLLTGGEPLLYPGFKELFIHLKKQGMILTLNTNGTLINEAWADFFAEYRPRRINITLYGANAETYEALCHYGEGFEKTMQGIRLLKARGLDIKISSSLTKINRNDLAGIAAIGDSLHIPVRMDTYMMPAIRQKGDFKNQVRLDPESAAICQMEALRLEMTDTMFHSLVSKYVWETIHLQPDVNIKKHSGCYAGRCSFSINWRGQLRPCVMMDEISADVFEYGFERAWQLVRQKMSEILLNTACSRCHLRSLCRTCPACAFLEEGQYSGHPDYMCRYTQKIYELMKQELEVRKHA